MAISPSGRNKTKCRHQKYTKCFLLSRKTVEAKIYFSGRQINIFHEEFSQRCETSLFTALYGDTVLGQGIVFP